MPADLPAAAVPTATVPEAYALAVRALDAGDLATAAHVVGCILAVRPEMPEALHLDGAIHLRAGRPALAIERFAASLKIRRSPTVLSSLGSALQICGRLDEAIAAQAEAAALDPAAPLWRRNLGILFQAAGRDGEAEAAFLAAARLGDAEAAYAVGRRRFERRDLGAAARAFRQACAVQPDHTEAMTGLGLCRTSEGADETEPVRLHTRALAVDPGRLEDAIHGLDAARTGLRFDLMEPWRARLAATLPLAFERAHWHLLSSVLYRDLYRPLPDPLRTRTESVLAARLQALAEPPPAAAPPAGRRLRVGYLSGLLVNHPVGQVTLSLFAAHDRARVETHGFLRSAAAPDDPYAARHRAGFERVHELAGLPSAAAAERIRAAGIDVLVYLDGHMDKEGLAIMARRPAPVRVFWLGHAGGIGGTCADYLIADRHVVPPGEEHLYAERVVRLPDCYHCADRHPIAGLPRRADYGLPEDAVVFCAFNNVEKIDEAAFRTWMDIMRQVPGSVLWLSGSSRSARLAAALEPVAAAAGVAPGRIVFSGRVPDKRDHLARYQLADLFLDTWTMNASSTALDALWAGVPIVARAGDRFSNRISASMLHAIGLGAFVCPDAAAYAALATALALNPALRADWRARLWANRQTTPLFDVDRFARRLEEAYGRMAALAAAGGPPQAFDL